MKKLFRNFENETDIWKCITRSNQHRKRFESSQICLRVPCRPSLILLKFSMIKSFIILGRSDPDWDEKSWTKDTYDLSVQGEDSYNLYLSFSNHLKRNSSKRTCPYLFLWPFQLFYLDFSRQSNHVGYERRELSPQDHNLLKFHRQLFLVYSYPEESSYFERILKSYLFKNGRTKMTAKSNLFKKDESGWTRENWLGEH